MILLSLPAYLLGSIPSGPLLARVMGNSDPRRTAIVSFLLDFLKGLLPVLAVSFYAPDDHITAYLAALFAVVGQCYSVFLLFKGGKGEATMAGAFAALTPIPAAAGLLVGLMTFYVLRSSSLAAMVALAAFFYAVCLLSTPTTLALFSLACGMMVIRRHHDDLSTLVNSRNS